MWTNYTVYYNSVHINLIINRMLFNVVQMDSLSIGVYSYVYSYILLYKNPTCHLCLNILNIHIHMNILIRFKPLEVCALSSIHSILDCIFSPIAFNIEHELNNIFVYLQRNWSTDWLTANIFEIIPLFNFHFQNDKAQKPTVPLLPGPKFPWA